MTDKVQKIREKIERKLEVMQYQLHRKDAYKELKSILDYIDFLQEEPVSEELKKVKRNRTMNKAEKFIQDCTKNCSNEMEWDEGGLTCRDYVPWLTSDQARKAVEIARKEIYEWLEENAVNFVGLADDEQAPIGDTKAFYGTKSLIHYLKQAMKDE